MRAQRRRVFGAALAAAWIAVRAQAAAAPGPAPDAIDLGTLTLAPLAGVTAERVLVPTHQGGPVARVSFTKTDEERRFVALESVPRQAMDPYKAVDLRLAWQLPAPLAARLAVLVYERGGGAWSRTGEPLAAADGAARDLRLSLQGLRQTGFSQDASGALEWEQVERLWLGLVVEGSGQGWFEIGRLALTRDAYVPTAAVELLRREPPAWAVAADPAVTGKEITTVDLDGVPCLRLRFQFAGGRHLYFTPSQALAEREYSAYAGLRLTYRAALPDGITGLLFMLTEHGGQFVATPAPPASADWRTVTLPWTAFALGGWSKDDNGRLDADAMGAAIIGAHGTASQAGGPGEIHIRSLELLPAIP